ncbi:hypothetical protein phi3396_10 [Streptococcus phage phi3396]|nr:hypothetical protein phi3396_10 [Streptococcus phage phi3396]ABN10783.1 hypothetical protein phi3396_10 [Streptococcus phage phi3396]
MKQLLETNTDICQIFQKSYQQKDGQKELLKNGSRNNYK